MSIVTYCASSPLAVVPAQDRTAGHALGRLLDGLLEHGGFALRQLGADEGRESRGLRALLDAGLLERRPAGFRLTSRAVRACEERLLVELLQSSASGAAPGGHRAGSLPSFAEVGDEPRQHRTGEPLGAIDLTETLRRALARGLPLGLREDDVVVRPAHESGRCATAVLLDLSGSMARHGKFAAARRAALALRALVRRRFPGDELWTGGFASRAEPLPGAALLEARPRDVGLFDPSRAEVRLPAGAADVPGHFTNIQDGLRLARRWLRGRANLGRQVVLLTDGEPTAHLEGEEVVLAYPPGPATLRATLAEARRCAGEGIAVSVLGLVGEFSPPGLAEFVGQLARAGGGSAACCSPRTLGSRIVQLFVRSRPVRR